MFFASNSRLVRFGIGVGLLVACSAAACSGAASAESRTAFGRACRSLGQANSVLIKGEWTQVQKGYAQIGVEAGGIPDPSLRAAAARLAARVATTAPDIDLARVIGGDADDALLASACQRQYGDDY